MRSKHRISPLALTYIFGSILVIFVLIFSTSQIIKSFKNRKPKVHGQSNVTSLNLPPLEQKISFPPIKKQNATKPYIPAKAVILLDADSAYPLYAKNARQEVAIASVTKIMTAIIAIENYNLNEVVTVPSNIYTVTGSKMHLYPKEKITVQNLLYGLMLNSGNDAAYTLASFKTKGNYKIFVTKMNDKAKLLGLQDTEFQDPAGLDDHGHSTAHDLAILTSYALKNPTFAKLVSTKAKKISSTDHRYQHTLKNTNRLIDPTNSLYLPYAIGVKTGFTDKAGHCLVTAARKNGHLLISVILNTNNWDASESAVLNKRLLQWGYANYSWPSLAK